MKAEKSDYGNFKVRFETATDSSYFYLFTHPTNCKVASIERVGSNLRRYPKPFINAIKKVLLKKRKTAFKITVKSKENIDLLKDYFPIIYCAQVPLGYGDRYQYHATFLKDKKSKYYKRLTEGVVLLDDGIIDESTSSTTSKD